MFFVWLSCSRRLCICSSIFFMFIVLRLWLSSRCWLLLLLFFSFFGILVRILMFCMIVWLIWFIRLVSRLVLLWCWSNCLIFRNLIRKCVRFCLMFFVMWLIIGLRRRCCFVFFIFFSKFFLYFDKFFMLCWIFYIVKIGGGGVVSRYNVYIMRSIVILIFGWGSNMEVIVCVV